jgi:hypothetical protein
MPHYKAMPFFSSTIVLSTLKHLPRMASAPRELYDSLSDTCLNFCLNRPGNLEKIRVPYGTLSGPFVFFEIVETLDL